MRKGEKAIPEQRKKFSEAAKKRWANMDWTPEMSKKRSEIASRINKGRVLSEETKKKIAKSVTGFKHSEETKKQMSETHSKIIGKQTNNWKGGISPYTTRWNRLSQSIKERDGFQCQISTCRKTSKILLTHHIDFDKKNDNPDNLITVCKSCHAIIHKLGREQGYKLKNKSPSRKS